MLARNDGQVRLLNNQLADFSGFLASERGTLSGVLQVLPPALEDVASFVRDNRDGLHTDVGKLASITDILVRQQKALTETFDVAPLALGNLTNSYNAKFGTLDVRPVLAPGLNLPTLNPADAPLRAAQRQRARRGPRRAHPGAAPGARVRGAGDVLDADAGRRDVARDRARALPAARRRC